MTLKEIIQKYNRQPHRRGLYDCNLMVLEMYEPEGFSQMHGTYHDLPGGVVRAKEVMKAPSMRYFLRHNATYTQVPPTFQRQGDIIVFHKGFNCYLTLGDKWFGVDTTDHFGFMSFQQHPIASYLVFRRSFPWD